MRLRTKQLAEFLMDAEVLKFGEFELKSGQSSPYYFNFGEVHSGKTLSTLGQHLAAQCVNKLGTGFEVVYGPPYKAISLAVVTCTQLWSEHQLDRPFLTYRKEEKKHGEGGVFLGHHLQDGDRVVMVDDVMTSGDTKIEALQRLQQEAERVGVRPPRCIALVVVVDRQERDRNGNTASAVFTEQTGIPVLALANAAELFASLRGDRLTEQQYTEAMAHLEHK